MSYICAMASLTIRSLDDAVKKRLQRQAAANGRSLEAEVREILTRNLPLPVKPDPNAPKTGLDLIRPLRDAVEKYGGVELKLPSRKSSRLVNIFEDAGTYEQPPPPKPRRKRRK